MPFLEPEFWLSFDSFGFAIFLRKPYLQDKLLKNVKNSTL